MIEPKTVEIEDQQGKTHTFKIGEMPYLDGGREVCSQYITTAAPLVGKYKENQELAVKMFRHISKVTEDGGEIKLTTEALINNHIPDFMTGVRLEVAALEHNVGFSAIGLIQEYRQKWVQDLPDVITKILTVLRDSLLQIEPPLSTTSKKNTPPKKH